MKAIVIPFVFLVGSHSVSGANHIGGALQDSLCSAFNSINICTPYPDSCTYEAFNNDGRQGFHGMYQRRCKGCRCCLPFLCMLLF